MVGSESKHAWVMFKWHISQHLSVLHLECRKKRLPGGINLLHQLGTARYWHGRIHAVADSLKSKSEDSSLGVKVLNAGSWYQMNQDLSGRCRLGKSGHYGVDFAGILGK